VEPGFLVLFLCFWLPAAVYTQLVVTSKGYSPGGRFFGALFFGPLALLAAVGLSDKKQRSYLRLLAFQQGATDEFLDQLERS